ncbi:GNAT family N-acetyltransferase [Clostridium frigidicarnis]|uniref:Predicted acetyltransferase n=1 Tax=Clostridium frigidicarnis TaxID=84698 RepID=A0A1I0Y4B5_9CLOT|nr:GNAT family N-acetyltransferase [Clostridium frigidicarnis]SFB07687.1 Predicted acetyltransferase [Clostridium frigidicarnis]
MELIRLNENFNKEFLKVWRNSFLDTQTFEEEFSMRFFSQDDLWNQAYGWIDDGKLISTYLSLDVKVLIRNKEVRAHYIDGIATLPEYRNKGLVFTQMLNDAKKCLSNNIPLMLVDPARDSLYRKFGFEFALNKYATLIPRDFLYETKDYKFNYKISSGFLSKNKKLQCDYKELSNWFWQNSRYNEMKWPKCYEDIKFLDYEVKIVVAYDDNDKPIAYALYNIGKTRMYIKSFRYMNLNGFYAIKNFILNIDNEITSFYFSSIPEDFPLDILISNIWANDRFLSHNRMISRMARIIDFRGLLEKLIVFPPKREISIYVKDDKLESNTGAYIISMDGKVMKEEKIDCEVITTIHDFVPLLTGLKSAEELYYNGKLKVGLNENIQQSNLLIPDCIKELTYILPKSVTYNSDEYLAP